MSTAAEFRDHLTDFSEHYASLGESSLVIDGLVQDCSNSSALSHRHVSPAFDATSLLGESSLVVFCF